MHPGHETWVTRDYGAEGKGLSMSKGRLGEFVYHLLKCGGDITNTYAMRPEMDRTYVQFAITLPKGKKAVLETATGVVLEKPPVLSFGTSR